MSTGPIVSRVGFRSDKGPSTTEIVIMVGIGIFLVITLLYLEYSANDCMRGKRCAYRRPDITDEDTPVEAVEKIQEMVKSNNGVVFWRQALLVAIILPVPLIYLLYSRFPTPLEWLFVGIFIFLGTYLSYSWIWSHYFNPNALTIQSNLQRLSDQLIRST